MKTKLKIEAREEGRGRPSITTFPDLAAADALLHEANAIAFVEQN